MPHAHAGIMALISVSIKPYEKQETNEALKTIIRFYIAVNCN
jgi:hypothetical protein